MTVVQEEQAVATVLEDFWDSSDPKNGIKSYRDSVTWYFDKMFRYLLVL